LARASERRDCGARKKIWKNVNRRRSLGRTANGSLSNKKDEKTKGVRRDQARDKGEKNKKKKANNARKRNANVAKI